MSAIDSAITRLQALALSSSDLTVRAAPSYPVEDAGVFPIAIAHVIEGETVLSNATLTSVFPTIAVDFHFNRTDLKKAYTDIDALIVEYSKKLGGDPTLSGAVDTIVSPIPFTTSPVTWGSVETIMLRFAVQIKSLEVPVST